MPEVNKKAAPQREVLEIGRIGGYGGIEYRHRLSCGHTEVRKRKAQAKYIACTLCAVVIIAKKELGELATQEKSKQTIVGDLDVLGTQINSSEDDINRMTADLASTFQIPNEMISITYESDENGNLEVIGATIWLDKDAIKQVLVSRRKSGAEDEYRIRRPLGNP